MDWITCPSCEEEFKVITESLETIAYCPFCAEILEVEDDEEEDEDDYWDDE